MLSEGFEWHMITMAAAVRTTPGVRWIVFSRSCETLVAQSIQLYAKPCKGEDKTLTIHLAYLRVFHVEALHKAWRQE